MKAKTRAIVLLSGGLDSILAVRALQEQGIEVVGISFESPFFKADKARTAAEQLGIELKVVKLKKDYIAMVKNPKHGHGSAINPCIDCHAFMLRKAKGMMKKLKADFIATGEVLNERPMSQNLESLKIVEEESGLKGKLLRPLSAKCLGETEAEKKGLVDRNKLLDIKGRTRNRQMELAAKWNLSYPTPGGGCLLCETEIEKKLLDLFKHNETDDISLDLIKTGRHFRAHGQIIVGRNKEENDKLEKVGKTWIKMECKDVLGPITLFRDEKDVKKAAELTAFHGRTEGKKTKVIFWNRSKKDTKEIEVEVPSRESVEEIRI